MSKSVSPINYLYITGITIRWAYFNQKSFDFAVNIENHGNVPVEEALTITLGVSFVSDWLQSPALSDTVEQTFQIPASTTIAAGRIFTSPYVVDVPYLVKPGTTSAQYSFTAILIVNGATAAEYTLSEPLVRPTNLHPGSLPTLPKTFSPSP